MSRTLLMTLCALLCCVLLWTPLRSDEPKRKSGPPAAPAEKPSDPERRLAEMEKHLAALAKEIEALRKDLKAKPAAPGAKGDAKAEFRVFLLKNAAAVEAAKVLTQIFRGDHPALAIVADERTNSLVMRGSVEDLAAAEAVLQRLDDAPGRDGKKPERTEKPQLRVFTLKSGSAAEVAKVLQALLGGEGNKSFRAVAEAQSNSVLVYAPEEQLAEIEALVVRLDLLAEEKAKENKKRGAP
jgi:type II secretory pathway component GspD/PulD (secretin)